MNTLLEDIQRPCPRQAAQSLLREDIDQELENTVKVVCHALIAHGIPSPLHSTFAGIVADEYVPLLSRSDVSWLLSYATQLNMIRIAEGKPSADSYNEVFSYAIMHLRGIEQ